jgi:[ribosomal protein S5]-alanine N-acetyltransferase
MPATRTHFSSTPSPPQKNRTSLPQVALLVDTLMVTTTAWIAIVVLLQSVINYRYLLRRHLALGPHPAKTYIGALLGAPLGIAMIAAHVMLDLTGRSTRTRGCKLRLRRTCRGPVSSDVRFRVQPLVPFPAIETDRLVLREIVLSDADALFEIHGDESLMRWFGVDPLKDIAGAEKLVALFASWRAQPNPGTRWGIQLKGEDRLCGTCGLFAWNRAWRKCTIGYELAAFAHGKGLMHEALSSVLEWGFANMELNRVEAQVHPENEASVRSVSRLGFQREGLLRQLGYWRGEYHDMLQYSLLHRDWQARRGEI